MRFRMTMRGLSTATLIAAFFLTSSSVYTEEKGEIVTLGWIKSTIDLINSRCADRTTAREIQSRRSDASHPVTGWMKIIECYFCSQALGKTDLAVLLARNDFPGAFRTAQSAKKGLNASTIPEWASLSLTELWLNLQLTDPTDWTISPNDVVEVSALARSLIGADCPEAALDTK